jgi:hypothetical protein
MARPGGCGVVIAVAMGLSFASFHQASAGVAPRAQDVRIGPSALSRGIEISAALRDPTRGSTISVRQVDRIGGGSDLTRAVTSLGLEAGTRVFSADGGLREGDSETVAGGAEDFGGGDVQDGGTWS